MSIEGDFRAAMAAHGLIYDGPIRASSAIQRVKCGEDKNLDTWYVLHPGPPAAGSFGNWRLSIKAKWRQRFAPSVTNQAEFDQKWRRQTEARTREEALRHERARIEAAEVLEKSCPADANHAYLQRKNVGVHGELLQSRDSLVLPLRDIAGRLNTLQFISADGSKRFLAGGRTRGCFFSIGEISGASLVIVEGYATGASIFSATGFQTICAMNCGNLMAVALAVRGMWPDRDIIIAADNDTATPGNPGLTHALAAARAISARVTVPNFNS